MGKNAWIVVAFLVAAVVVAVLKQNSGSEVADRQLGPTVGIGLMPAMLEIGSKGCVPCEAMQPVLEELRTEYGHKIKVVFHDIRLEKDVADKYKIQSIPTQVFLDKEGKELFRHEGFWPKEEIVAKFRELGVDL